MNEDEMLKDLIVDDFTPITTELSKAQKGDKPDETSDKSAL